MAAMTGTPVRGERRGTVLCAAETRLQAYFCTAFAAYRCAAYAALVVEHARTARPSAGQA